MIGSNRTFMELKSSGKSFGRLVVGSNRTFMELKLRIVFKSHVDRKCSNRTFMELKF